jgi:predicted HAD superfamily hydrolase
MRNELLHSLTGLRYPRLALDFPVLRPVAEQRARERSLRVFGTPEITIADIYTELGVMVGADASELERIMRMELQEELDACFANPTILQLYNEARVLGKRIAFCSDMYLPSVELRKMLRAAGYAADEPVLVSGEIKRSKHEGTLFADVSRTLGLSASSILHVGDNYEADYVMARRCGFKAWHFRERENVLRRISVPEEGRDYASQTSFSTIKGLIFKSLLAGSFSGEKRLERLGYEVFGPLITGFCLWLLGRLAQRRPEKLLLVARDAFPIYKLLSEVETAIGLDVPYEYVYLSRAALLLPSLTDCAYHRIWHLLGGRATRSARHWLERLGFPSYFLHCAASRLGFDLEVVPPSDPRVFDLLVREFPTLFNLGKEQRKLAKTYLEEVMGEAKHIALVDVGWNGSVQSSLARLINAPGFTIDGYYIGLSPAAREEVVLGHSMNGWLMEYGEPPEWRTVLEAGGAELLELGLAGPHGTTLGYRVVDGTVKPILENDSSEDELGYRAVAAKIQEGALRFAKEALHSLSVTPSKAETLASTRQWAAPFKRLVLSPTREEAELLSSITHSDAPTDTRVRLGLATRLSLWSRLNPATYRRAREMAFWKAGFDRLNRLWPW